MSILTIMNVITDNKTMHVKTLGELNPTKLKNNAVLILLHVNNRSIYNHLLELEYLNNM